MPTLPAPTYRQRAPAPAGSRGAGSTTEIRRDILAAARAEFAEYGPAGARIDHIAQNARVSTEVLYGHFSDKAALFREIVAADRDDYFGALAIDPEAVAEFVGDVFDLTQSHHEHTRLITGAARGAAANGLRTRWRRRPQHLLTAIRSAQDAGHIDSSWAPLDLLVMLFGIALAWAQFPDASSAWNDPATLATVAPPLSTPRNAFWPHPDSDVPERLNGAIRLRSRRPLCG